MTVRIQNRGLPMLLTLALTALAVSACRDAAEPAIPPTPQPAEALAQPSETAPAAAEEVAGSFFVSADAVDPMTVQLSLNRPNAPLLQNLAMGNFAFPAQGGRGGRRQVRHRLTARRSRWAPAPTSWAAGRRARPDPRRANPDYWDKEGGPKSEDHRAEGHQGRHDPLPGPGEGEIDGMNQVNPEDIVKG
ncbi:MAG: hypothetical protein IPJ58_02470 [Ardenticatenia bacterium]|nr:hypothetical protein [Ardenticatenia bacterium]